MMMTTSLSEMYRISDEMMAEALRLLGRLGARGSVPTEDERRRCRLLAARLARRERARTEECSTVKKQRR